ncbi:MAG: hypothetical protein WKG06_42190 [Segetibacter sp.]
MKRITLYLSLLVFSCLFYLYAPARQSDPKQEYIKLKKKLATGWNTWNTRSVLSHVLLPEAFSINLELEDGTSGRQLREALIGRRGNGVETIRPGIHSYDGAYTELTLEWQSIKLKVESAGKGKDLVILITPLNKSAASRLLIRPALLWDKEGVITKTSDGFLAKLSSEDLATHISRSIKDAKYKDSVFALASLEESIGISLGNLRQMPEIEKIIKTARKELLESYNKFPAVAEMHKAMQNVLAWDVIYEPTHDRVIAPVSRIWSTDAKGWVIFDWDTYFASWMFSLEDKELALLQCYCNY